ncbi:MAG: dicarboxylate/amino acid:cation symporter [Bryobacteraceae bacterium]|nr:dicarboxylate/amino acid:cation symporter [Bryobacteraceae bacterium]
MTRPGDAPKAADAAFIPTRLIFLALVAGVVLGLAANSFAGGHPHLVWIVRNVAEPVGQVWLRMLFMVVVPLIFSTMVLGVAQLGQLHRLGPILGKTLALFLVGTALAATLGLVLVNTVRPGAGLPPAVTEQVLAEYRGAAEKTVAGFAGFGLTTFINIVPRNPLDAAARGDFLALIFFALVFGAALARLPAEKARPLSDVLEAVAEVMVRIIGFVMKLAPLGVGMLVFATASRFGLGLLRALALYVIVVVAGLCVHLFGTISVLVRVLARESPVRFFRSVWVIMITAFSTSSSNATLPTSLRVSETTLGIPRSVSGFVLPLGATANMHGTALFEGVTVLFLAQVFGVSLSLADQIVVLVLAVITAIGAAGVPAGSIPLLALVLQTVNVPAQGIALILGVDRLLDMCRTTLNVIGDVATALCIARSEKLVEIRAGR